MISIGNEAGTVTVPGHAGGTVSVMVEDVGTAPDEFELTSSIQEPIDKPDFSLTADICPSSNTATFHEIGTPHHVDENINKTQKFNRSDDEPPGDF